MMKRILNLSLFAMISFGVLTHAHAGPALDCDGEDAITLQCQLNDVLKAVEESSAFKGAKESALAELLPNTEISDITIVQAPRCGSASIRESGAVVAVTAFCDVYYREGTSSNLTRDRLQITVQAEVRDLFERYYPVMRSIEIKPVH